MRLNIYELLDKTFDMGASDLHLSADTPPVMRIKGELQYITDQPLTAEETRAMAMEILNEEQLQKVESIGELDFSLSRPGKGRFRGNCFIQRETYAMAIRLLYFEDLSMEKLGIPPIMKELSRKKRGLVLITGPTGSGKSTTLATMINLINQERRCHIITLEDPIEYLHKNKMSIVHQREVGQDTDSFAAGLRSALRQDPDVILVGEMRDLETISTAITAAETGHLVLSTLHTPGAAKSVDRMIDVFPPHQQQQIRVQLAAVLEGIVYQQILPKADESGRVAAFEVLLATPAVRNLIREEKHHQIDSAIQTSTKLGMQSMDQALIGLYKRSVITRDTLMSYAFDMDEIRRQISSHF
ncbi:MAG TPA: type IV pili twitching motility protein PilT [Peptococcaceae bacterium]|nr:type IV pili twitching motility protein PilT [Peptococcaceae bacterium]